MWLPGELLGGCRGRKWNLSQRRPWWQRGSRKRVDAIGASFQWQAAQSIGYVTCAWPYAGSEICPACLFWGYFRCQPGIRGKWMHVYMDNTVGGVSPQAPDWIQLHRSCSLPTSMCGPPCRSANCTMATTIAVTSTCVKRWASSVSVSTCCSDVG